MSKYFSDDEGSKPAGKVSEKSWGHTLKLAGVASLLFMAFANPFIDSIFTMLPYCGGNAFAVFGIKILLFMMLFILAAKYLV